MPSTDPIRLLVVEDVPQVAQYIRGQVSEQSAVELVEIVSDGSRVIDRIERLQPEVVLVDLLLRGHVKGHIVVEQIRRSGLGVGVIAMTVPEHPVRVSYDLGVHGVLSMPFSGFELVNRVQQVHRDFGGDNGRGASRIVAVFAPKGGVGKTTIAFNLAAAFARLSHRTLLIDGSLQFGDIRTLLRVPGDVGSILDVPTDRILAEDLEHVIWHDPSGIDVLLAPPRVEMAEMVMTRDLDKLLTLLRREYAILVVDLNSVINDASLAFLDASTTIVEIVTPESTAIHNVVGMAETFSSIGYPPDKVRWLLNRADSSDGISSDETARMLGRKPDYAIRSDGRLVVRSNNDGVPFVLAQPDAPISRDVMRIASHLLEASPLPVAAGRA